MHVVFAAKTVEHTRLPQACVQINNAAVHYFWPANLADIGFWQPSQASEKDKLEVFTIPVAAEAFIWQPWTFQHAARAWLPVWYAPDVR